MCVHCLQVATYQKAIASMQQSSVQLDTTGQCASLSETFDKKVSNYN